MRTTRDCSVRVQRFRSHPVLNDPRSIYGHIDFLGKGSTSLLEDVRPHIAKTVPR